MGFERPERTVVRPKEQARAVIRRKVEVGAADSPYELEADRIARTVMRRLDSSATSDPMSSMADAFGADFGNVRLHTDSSAAAMSESLQARAFTHGSDVYFGAGQFQPGSRGGQELLAHELTHTIQQGAAPLVGSGADAPTADNGRAVRRAPLPSISRDSEGSVRRWALDRGVDLTQTVALRTAGTAQQTFMAKDATNKEIVIKPGSVAMNLLKLADTINASVHENSYVQSFEVDAGQKAILSAKISDASVSSHSSWDASGKATPGAKKDGEDDAAKARRIFANMVATTNSPLTAMRVVDGSNAKQLAKVKGSGANAGGSAMRDRLESPLFMRAMGRSIVADAFTGNGDRVTAGNLGNFMSADKDDFTMIDNMDTFAGKNSFLESSPDGWIPDELVKIGTDPRKVAEKGLNTVIRMLGFEGEDPAKLKAWVDEAGANRRQFMLDDMVKGMDETRDRIVQTYAIRKNRKKTPGRALKNTVKSIGTDANQVDFWEIMKARATALKDPAQAKKMKERLQKRHNVAKKKAAKKG